MTGSARSAENEPSTRRFKRPRVLVACQRCKTKRQKCDNASPACSNCARASAACVYSENVYPSSYVKMLEQRVGELEGRSTPLGMTPQGVDSMDDRARPDDLSPAQRTSRPQVESTTRAPPSDRLALGLGVLSSCAAAEPHYFGFSSGLSLAHFVQAAIDTGTSTESEVSLPLLADRPFSHQIPTARTPLAPLPTPGRGGDFLKAYLAIIHPLYPFLDRRALWKMHQHQTRSAQHPSPESQLDLAVLHLVYAIGSRCLQLLGSSKVPKHIPEGHFVSAMKYIPEAMKFTSMRSIEITLLLGLHSMRSPSGASVWHLCGLALRQCLELGLHKQRTVDSHHIRQDQRRKRLFWSAFIFERKTALILGRPFGLSEEEVDAAVPLDVNDAEEDPAILTAALEAQLASDDSVRTYSTLSLHRCHVLLYRIHSKIRFTLHRLKISKQRGNLSDKISSRFEELDEWKENVLRQYAGVSEETRAGPELSDEGERDTSSDSEPEKVLGLTRSLDTEKTELLLEYHKARRSLLQPLMTEGGHHYAFGLAEFAACADSSGQICQLYRRLHRLSAIPFTLRDLHAVFVAGFTLIYCICARPSLYNAQRAGDIGACSTVLYVITEQWPSARKYRDAFEVVAERIVERTANLAAGDAVQATSDSSGVQGQNRSKQRSRSARGVRMHATSEAADNDITPVSHSDVANVRKSGDQPDYTTSGFNDSRDETSSLQYGSLGVQNSPLSPGSSNLYNEPFSYDTSGFGLGINLASEFDEIEGLLTNEGMDWFADAVL